MAGAFLAALVSAAVAGAGAAPSFDCAKARAADERLVCANAELARLDREIAARYAATVRAAPPAEAAELRGAQRAWLSERASCTRAGAPGGAPPRAWAVRCVERSSRWRLDDLSAAPQRPALPAGVLARRLVRHEPAKAFRVAVDYPALTGRPGAAAFDAFFRRLAEAWAPAAERLDVPEEPDDEDLGETTLEVGFTVPLAGPRLVTVVSRGYEHSSGAAHGTPFTRATTFDLARGRPLTLGDVFATPADVPKVLGPKALARVEGADEWDGAAENAAKAMGDVACWTFDADGAVVTFPAYAVGPYAVGEPEARFTWTELKPLLRPDAPFPVQ